MEWMQSIDQALQYMEEHLNDDINVEDVSNHVFASVSHFQRIFNLVTGYSIGEYLRNRRLSVAGRELAHSGKKVIDVAYHYQYDTPESFSKAFVRFHGINPSDAKKQASQLRYFYPLTVKLLIQGGFDMTMKYLDEFVFIYPENDSSKQLSAEERYRLLTQQAVKARCQNPTTFDMVTEWILDDNEWTEDKLKENQEILMNGILGRFKEQNRQLRACLQDLQPSGVVNEPVFRMLDRFDRTLNGICEDAHLQDTVSSVFRDFSVMKDKEVRKLIAGNKTGATGTDSVEIFGYVNRLKECDAGVQWTLFMPGEVLRKQQGFHVSDFVYLSLPAMRLIYFEGEEYVDIAKRMEKMKLIDALSEYKSGFDYDLFLMHFNGEGVDVGTWHGVFGRFMKADTPVPEGLSYIDFLPDCPEVPGVPYLSKFAFATFKGDVKAMHNEEGFDGDAMYDITRNIILGQGGCIPYPDKYWTAEVYFNGCDKESTGYLFSAFQPE